MTRVLSTGEWRLFLLSDCIKYYKDIAEFTSELRRAGKNTVLQLTGEDTKQLDNFIDKTDAQAIRGMLRKEWYFTGKVTDRGSNNLTTCEYCQKQQIRYEYWCKSRNTGVELSLGSVCVGYVIHGEEKMQSQVFKDNFLSEMDKIKSNPEVPMEKQKEQIRLYVGYLRGKGITEQNSEFLRSLHKRWTDGIPLTGNQIKALEDMCKKIKYDSKGELKFNSLDAEIHYQKVLRKLEERPDSQFYQACKLRIERFGELTPNMAKALMG